MKFVCADGDEQSRTLLDVTPVQAAGHELVWFDGPPSDGDEWLRRLDEADGVMLMWEIPRGVLSAAESVRVVSFAGSGAGSYVPIDEAGRRGVVVCNVPSYGANAVAEHAFSLAFALARKLCQGDRLVRTGRWRPGALAGVELAGRRLGVVGAGPIGARVVQIGRALGMSVVAWTRSPSRAREEELRAPFVTLEQLFAESDVVSLHLAHRPETERLVDERLLGLMQPHALLVNTARSQLVETDALVGALAEGRIGGAAIDAFEQEPLPADDQLLRAPNLLLTPHVGFNTPEATAELLRLTLENLLAFAAGRPQNVYADGSR
ncbi:MAG: D-isomer specific 2-hydroxyacid dehydrogenase family protein [Actinomycetota bacterium]|nr:D-isomer specific 2-hydroxyacid dehydrogenase family protein [Actinomycetota bacterium]